MPGTRTSQMLPAMKAVVLDANHLNLSDQDWKPLEQVLDLHRFGLTPHQPGTILKRAREYEVIFTERVPLPAPLLKQLPRLKAIALLGPDDDFIDHTTCHQQGIALIHLARQIFAKDAARLTLACIMHSCLPLDAQCQFSQTHWLDSPTPFAWPYPVTNPEEITLGIIGFGRAGRLVAQWAHQLGFQVQITSPSAQPNSAPEYRVVTLDTLLQTSDLISLHCPLTAETQNLIQSERLKQCRPGSVLINTAHGKLVDETAVAVALHQNRLKAFYADRLRTEPISTGHVLLRAPRVFLTGGLSLASLHSRRRLVAALAEFFAQNFPPS